MRFVPVAVGALGSAKIICRPSRVLTLSVSCGDVAEQRPRGLRRRRELRAAAPCGLAVRTDVLAEAAVILLHRVEPPCCLQNRGVIARKSARLERRQRSTGAVDVIHAPAAEPRAVVLLLRQ